MTLKSFSKQSLYYLRAVKRINNIAAFLSVVHIAMVYSTPLNDWRNQYLKIASLFADTLSSPSGMFWDDCDVDGPWGKSLGADTARGGGNYWAFEPGLRIGLNNRNLFFGKNSYYHADLLSDIRWGNLKVRNMLNVDSRYKDDSLYYAHKQRVAAGRFGEAYLQLDNRYGFVRLGRLERNWGPFADRSLVVSSNPFSFDALEWQLRSSVFEFRQLFSWFYNRNDLDRFELGNNRYFVAHALMIKPHRFVWLGLFESELFVRKNAMPDLQYINPFAGYTVLNTNQEGSGNTMLGFQWNIKPFTERCSFKGQLLIDDIQIDNKDITDNEPNHLGGDFGIHAHDFIGMPLPHAVSIEYRFMAPWLYTVADINANAGERYTYFGKSLGMEDNDLDRVSSTIAIVYPKYFINTIDVAFQRKGENTISTRWRDSEEGATPGLPINYANTKFPSGIVEKSIDIRCGIIAYWPNVVDAKVEFVNRWISNKDHVPSDYTYLPEISVILSLHYSGLFVRLPQR